MVKYYLSIKLFSNQLSNLRSENWIYLSNLRADPENGVSYIKKNVYGKTDDIIINQPEKLNTN